MSEANSGHKYKKIMCFDGGGINGLFTIRLLQRICAVRPGFMDNIARFSGTSAGAINALILAQYKDDPTYGLAQCDRLWHEPGLFTTNPWELPLAMCGLAPILSAENFRRVLSKYIREDLKLRDLPIAILITAFDLQSDRTGSWEPTFFSGQFTPDTYALDVALRACALPVLTAVQHGYIDGGVFNPSPALSALAMELSTETIAGVIVNQTQQYAEDIQKKVEEALQEMGHTGEADISKSPEAVQVRMTADLEEVARHFRNVMEEMSSIEEFALPEPDESEPEGRMSYAREFTRFYKTVRTITQKLSSQHQYEILRNLYSCEGNQGGILVLSLGTGRARNDLMNLPRDRATPWGLLQWMMPGPWNNFGSILSLMLDSMEDVIDMNIFMLQSVMPFLKGYHRLNPTITYPPIPATLACAAPWLRDFVLNQIDADVRKLTTQNAIREAITWGQMTGWDS